MEGNLCLISHYQSGVRTQSCSLPQIVKNSADFSTNQLCWMPLSKLLLSNDFTVNRHKKNSQLCNCAAVKAFSMDEEGEVLFKAGTHCPKNT